jgi:RNA polymerase sigma-70 factor (ECF subfamily)
LETLVLEANGREVTAGDVINACRRGDPDAFRALFEAHKNRVYSIALRYSGDTAAAMDIAQDTFLKVLSQIQKFRGEADLETWIYRIAVNACLDDQRRTRKLMPFLGEFIDAISARGESVLHRLMRDQTAGDVQRVVARLPSEQRMVVVLRYTEGLSYDEIARILGCSAGTVASRLNRAHKVLERKLSHLRGV